MLLIIIIYTYLRVASDLVDTQIFQRFNNQDFPQGPRVFVKNEFFEDWIERKVNLSKSAGSRGRTRESVSII